jgi:hypothetical protein
LSVLTNSGNASFALSSSPGVCGSPVSVTAADVNGDGRMDLISANYASGALSVLTNSGNASFALSSSPGVGGSPASVTAADVNGDGRMDLISANYNASTLSVLTNTLNYTARFAGSFTGSGGNLTDLNASQLTGTVADARLSTNVGLLDASQIFTGSNSFAGAVQLTNAANTLAGTFAGNGGGLTNLVAANLTGTMPAARFASGAAFTAPFEVTSGGWLLEQQQTVGNSSLHWADAQWQSFTAGTNGTMVGVALYYGATDAVSDWSATLSIHQGEGTGGALLARQTVTGDGTVKIREFPLLTPVAVTNGTQYTIVMDSDVSCRWALGYGDYYAGGRCHYSASYDFWFRTFLDSGTSAASLVIRAASPNVGVGESSPGFPLSFPNTLGDKITLWGQSGAHYGFGIQSSLLQIFSGGASADIAFGYGESTNMTERVRFKGNGNVGIGTNSPSQKLVVAGNILATGTLTASDFVGSAAGLTNLDAADLTGTLAVGRLPAEVVTNNASAVTLTGTFAGNGGGLTNLDAADLTGTLAVGCLPAAVVTNNASGVTLTGTFVGNGGGLTNLLSSGDYAFAYSSVDQPVTNTTLFQDITCNVNGPIDGWTHTVSTASFTCTQTGLYWIQFDAEVLTDTTASSTVSLRAVLDGVELAGSQAAFSASILNLSVPLSKGFLAVISSGAVLKFQLAGSNLNNSLVANTGTGTTRPSFSCTIIRIK